MTHHAVNDHSKIAQIVGVANEEEAEFESEGMNTYTIICSSLSM